jgi:hypothetical protein
MPFVAASETAGKAAVLPGMVDVIAGIVRAGVVTYPDLSIHVGNVGMAWLVTVVAIRFDGMGRGCGRLGPTPRNRWMRGFMMLRKRGNSKYEQCCKR